MLELEAVTRILPKLVDTRGRKSTLLLTAQVGKEFQTGAGRSQGQGPALGFPSGCWESRGRGAARLEEAPGRQKHSDRQSASGGDRGKAEER